MDCPGTRKVSLSLSQSKSWSSCSWHCYEKGNGVSSGNDGDDGVSSEIYCLC